MSASSDKRFSWVRRWADAIPSAWKNRASWMCHCYAAHLNPQDFDAHRRVCKVPVPAGWYDSIVD